MRFDDDVAAEIRQPCPFRLVTKGRKEAATAEIQRAAEDHAGCASGLSFPQDWFLLLLLWVPELLWCQIDTLENVLCRQLGGVIVIPG
jgi:hypothetical protein